MHEYFKRYFKIQTLSKSIICQTQRIEKDELASQIHRLFNKEIDLVSLYRVIRIGYLTIEDILDIFWM